MLATNPEEPPEERQRRELEEIRRKFQEVGARLGSAFEPASSDDDDRMQRAALPPAPPVDQPARPRWQQVTVALLVFLLGTGFGYVLTRSGAGDPPGTPSAKAAPTTRPPATSLAPQSRPQVKVVVPPACLETARQGDEVFALLSSNVRVNDRRLADAIKAYTLASQACRKETSP